MTRFLLKLIPALVVVFVVLNVAARTLGMLQQSHPALAGFTVGCESQPQPCWHGIVPGVTTAEEAIKRMAFAGEPDVNRSILSRDSYTLVFVLTNTGSSCRANLEFIRDVLVQARIILCSLPEVRLGDLAVFLEREEKTVSLPPNDLVYGRISMKVVEWSGPYRRVSSVILLAPDARFQHFPWRGYVSQNRYCQLEPSYPLCGL